MHQILSFGNIFCDSCLIFAVFLVQYQYLSTVRLTKASFLVIRFFSLFLLYFYRKERLSYGH